PVRGERDELLPALQDGGRRARGPVAVAAAQGRLAEEDRGAGGDADGAVTAGGATMSQKKLRCIQRRAERHWGGNGFPVRTPVSYPTLGPVLSPFLLLDYAGPAEFPSTTERRGVGEHPHRGFETVTIV